MYDELERWENEGGAVGDSSWDERGIWATLEFDPPPSEICPEPEETLDLVTALQDLQKIVTETVTINRETELLGMKTRKFVEQNC